MRRWLPPVLAFLGSALLVFGLLAWLWIGPQVRQAPIDQQSRTVSLGSGSYYDFSTGEMVTTDQVRSVINTESDQSVYQGDDPVGDDIGVYEQTSGLFDDAADYTITYSGPTRIALDRETALPVRCCGADEEIEGLTIKWPFGVAQGDYEIWDGTLGAAATATFAGEDDIDGLPVYRFDVQIPETDVGPATEDAEYPRVMYEATKAYYVEPTTGRIIDSEQQVHQWAVDESGEVLFDAADVSVQVSDETVADNLDLARSDTSSLRLLDLLTWLGPLVGLILLVAAVFLFRPGGRSRSATGLREPAGSPSPTASGAAPRR